ncbi:MAG TPA: acyl carrier protein [Anaeromyxobacter sp.]|nr:acyl carrier protein [Anaeromyxobacter sp.]
MVSEKLRSVIRAQLRLDASFPIEEETSAPRVPGWDSLAHVALLAAVEHAFGVRFRTLEVLKLRNVGDLQALVDRKLGG